MASRFNYSWYEITKFTFIDAIVSILTSSFFYRLWCVCNMAISKKMILYVRIEVNYARKVRLKTWKTNSYLCTISCTIEINTGKIFLLLLFIIFCPPFFISSSHAFFFFFISKAFEKSCQTPCDLLTLFDTGFIMCISQGEVCKGYQNHHHYHQNPQNETC